MWLYFNQDGQLTRILEHGTPARVGSTAFEIFAVFESIDTLDKLRNYNATISLTKPDLDGFSYPTLLMKNATATFDKRVTETEISPFEDGKTYFGFYFDFATFNTGSNQEILLDTDGLWQATINVIGPTTGGVVVQDVQGIATFNVSGISIEEPTQIDYTIVMNQIVADLNERAYKNQVIIAVEDVDDSIDKTKYEDHQMFYSRSENRLYELVDNQFIYKGFPDVEPFLSTTSLNPVQNRVITNELYKCRIITDFGTPSMTIRQFYETYGLGLYIIRLGNEYFVFNFKAYTEGESLDTITASLYPLQTSIKQYYADNLGVNEQLPMTGIQGWMENINNIYVENLLSSNFIGRLSAQFGRVLFTLDDSNELYIGHLFNEGTIGSHIIRCEIESLSSTKRWYSDNVSLSTKLEDFMVDANRADYALESYVDSIAETIKKNAFIDVDIEDYPTLSSFLQSEGEEGYIYLYPIDTSEAPNFESGYYQYIWENDAWRFIGTTQIDLSGYVTLSSDQTISGTKTIAENTYLLFQGTTYSGGIRNNSSALRFYFDSNERLRVGLNDVVITGNELRPGVNNASDLGTASYAWKDLYLSRNLTDGTNSYTVAESFGVIFNKLGTGSTVIKWSELCLFDLTTNTTFTFETPKASSVPEYKAIINNNGAGSITLTFTGVTNILCNDDNCVVTNGTDSTLVLPTGVSIEISVLDGMMVAINFEAQ